MPYDYPISGLFCFDKYRKEVQNYLVDYFRNIKYNPNDWDQVGPHFFQYLTCYKKYHRLSRYLWEDTIGELNFMLKLMNDVPIPEIPNSMQTIHMGGPAKNWPSLKGTWFETNRIKYNLSAIRD